MDYPEEHWSNYDATKINASLRKILKSLEYQLMLDIQLLHLQIFL